MPTIKVYMSRKLYRSVEDTLWGNAARIEVRPKHKVYHFGDGSTATIYSNKLYINCNNAEYRIIG